MRTLVIRCTLLLFACFLRAQTIDAQAQAFQVERFTTAEGLPSPRVRSILQDQLGFLWMASQAGLVRYDGYEFATYRPDANDATSIGGLVHNALDEDARGDLWVGGVFAPWGLSRFDRRTERFTTYRHDPLAPNSLSSDAITAIHASRDSAHVIWVGTSGGGLNRLDAERGAITHYRHDAADPKSLNNDFVYALYEDRDGVLWIGSWGLNRFDPATSTFTHFYPDPRYPLYHPTDEPENQTNVVRSIYEDRDGVFWIGTDRGLHRFDRSTGSFQQFLPYPAVGSDPRNSIRILFEDQHGLFWVGTSAGAYTFERAQERFTRREEIPSSNAVLSIMQDQFGALWVSSDDVGITKLVPNRNPFTIYQHIPDTPNSLSDDHIGAIYEDREGSLWVGSSSVGLLDRVDRETGTVTTYRHDPNDPSSLSQGYVQDIYEDRAGTLWVLTGCGGALNRMDRAKGTFTQFEHDPNDPSSLSGHCVTSVLEDRAGRFWVATYSDGLNRMDRETGRFTRYQHDPENPNSLASNEVISVYEDRSSTLWVSTSIGLSRFNPEEETFTNYEAPGLVEVMMTHEDREGRFWIATAGGGLHLFDRKTGSSVVYATEDGLPHNIVRAILEDDRGLLWLSTGNGLSRFDPSAKTFKNYYSTDGLLSNVFHERAHFKSPSGELFFGGQGGGGGLLSGPTPG